MDDLTDHQNPFAAPIADSEEQLDPNHPDYALPLAGRFTRLVASIVDSIIMTIAGLPVNYFLYGDFYRAMLDPSLSPADRQQAIQSLQPSIGATAIGFLGGIAIFLLINGYWLARDGQSVGKKLLGVKIVRTDGSQATLARIFGVRILPFWLIPLIPILGGLMILVDILLIFRGTRQCLHDQVADTIVVKAGS